MDNFRECIVQCFIIVNMYYYQIGVRRLKSFYFLVYIECGILIQKIGNIIYYDNVNVRM